MSPIAATLLLLLSFTDPGGSAATQPEVAVFAGGCFWCMEPPFDRLKGVLSTTSGYTDGHVENPTYKQVCSGTTGHTEAVRVTYDPDIITYEKLLDTFWRNIDPTDATGQFCDKGTQYRTAIFYRNDVQKQLAQQSKTTLEQSGRFNTPLATRLARASVFYPAEKYHQDYYLKNPSHYKTYRYHCGRDRRLEALWGQP